MVNNEKVILLEPEELGKNAIAECLSALSTPVKAQETVCEDNVAASLPRESIESWLSRAAEIEANTSSSSSRKRRRSHSPESTPHHPTKFRETSEELKELETEMQTPSKSTSTPENLTTPNTASQKAKAQAKEGKAPASVIWIKSRLRDHGMYQRDHRALKKYPEFEKQARAIIGKTRGSPTNESSVRKLQQKWEYFESDNEDTLIDNLLPCIIKDMRTVPPGNEAGTAGSPSTSRPQDSNEQADEVSAGDDQQAQPINFVKRDFWDDGIVRKRNCNFLDSFLPIDDDLTKALAKADGLTNPRPDCIYGLNTNKYPPRPKAVKASAETQRIRGIVQNMYDPALVIEGKSARGEDGEAVNQACRGGAALVNAGRLLRERIGDPDVEGADDRTFVYTVALGARDLEIFVNWAEVLPDDAEGDKTVIYHMNQLNIQSYTRDGFLQENRDILHNILDWACLARHEERVELYKRMFEWEKQQKEQKDTTSQAGRKRPRTEKPPLPQSDLHDPSYSHASVLPSINTLKRKRSSVELQFDCQYLNARIGIRGHIPTQEAQACYHPSLVSEPFTILILFRLSDWLALLVQLASHSTVSLSSKGTSTEASSFAPLPPSTPTVLPLTEENLWLLDGANMPQGASSPSTPKSKATTAKSTLDSVKPKKASDVLTVLELNNMFIDDTEAYMRYPALAESVKTIMGHRESTMKPEQLRELAKIRKDFEYSTETAFLVNFMTKLIADKRLVKSAELPESTDDGKQYIERAWSAERLRTAWLAPFRKEALPPLNIPSSDKALKELLDKSPRVTNPVPDMTFGLFQDAFTATDRIINNRYFPCVEACPQSLHSWFLVECKTAGPVVDAINQACRGGAALVFTRRHFNALADPKGIIPAQGISAQTPSGHHHHQQQDEPSIAIDASQVQPAHSNARNSTPPSMADVNSVAFSMVLTPHVANIYVHWAEIQGNDIRFHMNMVQDRSIASPMGTGLSELRRDVDNILDWGTLGRKRDIQGVLKMIRRNAGGADEDDEPGGGGLGVDTDSYTGLGSAQPTAKRAKPL